jgi:glyceraldehyde-3-phosphate dehydrogenase (NADP+)
MTFKRLSKCIIAIVLIEASIAANVNNILSHLWYSSICTQVCCDQCSGQRCTAVKVVLIMESVADAVVQKVNAKLAKLKVGTPEDDSDITPVVTESSANFIEGLVMNAKEKGATFCQEYRREGNLIWPLLLDHVRPDMRIAWEEPFGPVVPVIRINSVEEGIHHCNASNFGLQVFRCSPRH